MSFIVFYDFLPQVVVCTSPWYMHLACVPRGTLCTLCTAHSVPRGTICTPWYLMYPVMWLVVLGSVYITHTLHHKLWFQRISSTRNLHMSLFSPYELPTCRFLTYTCIKKTSNGTTLSCKGQRGSQKSLIWTNWGYLSCYTRDLIKINICV